MTFIFLANFINEKYNIEILKKNDNDFTKKILYLIRV